MARIETETQLNGPFRRGLVRSDRSLPVAGCVLPCITFRIHLDPVCACFSSTFHHPDVRINEDGYANASLAEYLSHGNEVLPVFDRIPSVIGSDLIQGIRNKCYLCGEYLQNEINKFFFLAIAFYIELRRNDLLYIIHILIPDMSFVRTGMNGHPVCAKLLGIRGCLDDVGIVTSAAVAQRRKLVDIDREFGHGAKLKVLSSRCGSVQSIFR